MLACDKSTPEDCSAWVSEFNNLFNKTRTPLCKSIKNSPNILLQELHQKVLSQKGFSEILGEKTIRESTDNNRLGLETISGSPNPTVAFNNTINFNIKKSKS